MARHRITLTVVQILESDQLNGTNNINTLYQALSDFNIISDDIALHPNLPSTKKGDGEKPRIFAEMVWANTTSVPPKSHGKK